MSLTNLNLFSLLQLLQLHLLNAFAILIFEQYEYLKSKHKGMKEVFLNFQGRNRVLYMNKY